MKVVDVKDKAVAEAKAEVEEVKKTPRVKTQKSNRLMMRLREKK